MASRTPKKRARIDAAAKDSTSSSAEIDVGPSRCQTSPPNSVTASSKVKCYNAKCNSDCSVQNDASLRGHCTNERRVRKWDKESEKRCDLIRRSRRWREMGQQ